MENIQIDYGEVLSQVALRQWQIEDDALEDDKLNKEYMLLNSLKNILFGLQKCNFEKLKGDENVTKNEV